MVLSAEILKELTTVQVHILFCQERLKRIKIQSLRPNMQMMLFPEMASSAPVVRSRKGRGRINISAESLETKYEATTLDRVHEAMLLQAGGRANALRSLLKSDQDRGPEFLMLANALSALYPKGSVEKRLIDAMLLAVPR